MLTPAFPHAAHPSPQPPQPSCPPPVQLGIWDPKLLPQIKDVMDLLIIARVQEHLMRGPQHRGIKLLVSEVAVFEQPRNAWLDAMLKGRMRRTCKGNNSLDANGTKIITIIHVYYRHPGPFIKWWVKAVGVVEGTFSRAAHEHFP
ncbi:hypothetical protein QJQ45_004063 [Haematococcus lacustris]|nr:hypothetical protein QJQ45_004063 [Haematococcus lacustris]